MTKPQSKREPTSTAVTGPTPSADEERAFVQEYAERRLGRGPRRPPKLISKQGVVRPDPEQDIALFWAQLTAATGSPHPEAGGRRFTELMGVFAGKDDEIAADNVKRALADMLDIAPRDGVEGMLATQMVSVHKLLTNQLYQMANAEGTSLEVANFRINAITRLGRLFARQLEALQMYRGKGPSEQKVTVQHVHVHDGGQAVVGTVTPGGKG